MAIIPEVKTTFLPRFAPFCPNLLELGQSDTKCYQIYALQVSKLRSLLKPFKRAY